MKFKWDSKYLHWGITAFCVIVASILFFLVLSRLDAVAEVIGFVFNLLMPFIIGLVFAYLLSPLVDWFEDRCFKPLLKKITKKECVKPARVIAIVITYLLVFVILGGMGVLAVQQLIESLTGLIRNLSNYFGRLEGWVLGFVEGNPQLTKFISEQFTSIAGSISSWATNDLLPQLTNMAGGVTVGLMTTVTIITNLLVGLVVSIYILFGKESFFAQTKKFTYAVFSIKTTNALIRMMRRADRIFGQFVKGKLIEALIVGMLTFVGMSIFDMPFATLIAVIIGLTNIIPFFGPIIGMVVSIVLILMVDPMTALYFTIFIIVIQQLDGNLIGPKILGESTGLSSFWVIFSIMVFGGIFGVVGMLIGVPTFALLYSLICEVAENRLKKNEMPTESVEYEQIDHINQKEEIVYRKSASSASVSGRPE